MEARGEGGKPRGFYPKSKKKNVSKRKVCQLSNAVLRPRKMTGKQNGE